jgi:nitrogen regulatory protein PII
MKLIVAMIHPEMRDAVRAALRTTETPLICVTDVLDLRKQTTEMFRGAPYQIPQLKTRLEVLVINDLLVDEILETLSSVTNTGTGDGRQKIDIVVMPVEGWIPAGSRPRALTPAVAA